MIGVSHSDPVLLIGTALAGAGIGSVSIATLTSVVKAMEVARYAVATALWSACFDSGIAVGGIGLGVVASLFGYRSVFMAASIGLAAVMPLAIGQRPAGREPPPH